MCACDQRKEWLNDLAPTLGLGNRVAVVAEPIKEKWDGMNKGAILLMGIAIGYFVIPWGLRFAAERR
jgi:hypothetical protein